RFDLVFDLARADDFALELLRRLLGVGLGLLLAAALGSTLFLGGGILLKLALPEFVGLCVLQQLLIGLGELGAELGLRRRGGRFAGLEVQRLVGLRRGCVIAVAVELLLALLQGQPGGVLIGGFSGNRRSRDRCGRVPDRRRRAAARAAAHPGALID